MAREIILAVESSCDDTAAAVCIEGKVVAQTVARQVAHAKYGGVVPELASRQHTTAILPVVQAALHEAQVTVQDLTAVAFTQGPGLLGALLVGTSYAKGLALSLGIPLVGVNHLEGHALSVLLTDPAPTYPYLVLTVSGGHTQLDLAHGPLVLEPIGSTLDDAAGEAFDKIAKLLGLPYPGGPELDRLAQNGDPTRHTFKPPQIAALDFSFSGLKTQVLYYLRNQVAENPAFIEQERPHLAAGAQHVIVSFLLDKLFTAAEQTGAQELAVVGGVSANSALRTQLEARAATAGYRTYVPPLEYCTDNAAMIALAAHHKLKAGQTTDHFAVPYTAAR